MYGAIQVLLWGEGNCNSSNYIHARFCGDKYVTSSKNNAIIWGMGGLIVSKVHVPPPLIFEY